MVSSYVQNDFQVFCAVCHELTKNYFIVPRGVSEDIYTIVLHKLCKKCYEATDGGVA